VLSKRKKVERGIIDLLEGSGLLDHFEGICFLRARLEMVAVTRAAATREEQRPTCGEQQERKGCDWATQRAWLGATGDRWAMERKSVGPTVGSGGRDGKGGQLLRQGRKKGATNEGGEEEGATVIGDDTTEEEGRWWPMAGKRSDCGKDQERLPFPPFFFIATARWQGRMRDGSSKMTITTMTVIVMAAMTREVAAESQ
ncbi:hypothetical protein BHE74_00041461, partial [Ensete ventricosum]